MIDCTTDGHIALPQTVNFIVIWFKNSGKYNVNWSEIRQLKSEVFLI